MKLPETITLDETNMEDIQEEIVSLAEDIMDINEDIDDVNDCLEEIKETVDDSLEIQKAICESCIEMCNVIDRSDARIVKINDRVNYLMDDVEDKSITWKIVTAILVTLFIVWNLILTYHICYGL